jgi:hypothetical protein
MTEETHDIDAIQFEIDPQPFGPPRGKPSTRSPCRVTSIRPYPSSHGPEGFETVLTICMETPDHNFQMSIDARSARFVFGCLADYLKPFHSSGEVGTPSADALKPSLSSQSPAETLAHAVER